VWRWVGRYRCCLPACLSPPTYPRSVQSRDRTQWSARARSLARAQGRCEMWRPGSAYPHPPSLLSCCVAWAHHHRSRVAGRSRQRALARSLSLSFADRYRQHNTRRRQPPPSLPLSRPLSRSPSYPADDRSDSSIFFSRFSLIDVGRSVCVCVCVSLSLSLSASAYNRLLAAVTRSSSSPTSRSRPPDVYVCVYVCVCVYSVSRSRG
jgi:hypothetical protein